MFPDAVGPSTSDGKPICAELVLEPVICAELQERQRLGLARAHDVGQDHLIARLLGSDVEAVDAIVEMIVVGAARNESRGRRHGGDPRNATPHLTPPEDSNFAERSSPRPLRRPPGSILC